jgi:hypothetical protein
MAVTGISLDRHQTQQAIFVPALFRNRRPEEVYLALDYD